MTARVKVFRCVLVGRRVAAKRRAAGLTCTQVHPLAFRFDTLLADMLLRLPDIGDRLQMRAQCHDGSG